MIVKIPPPLFRSHFQFYVRRNLSRSKFFGRTVDPISTRGADYANHSTTSPPGFSDLATAQKGNIIAKEVKVFFDMKIL